MNVSSDYIYDDAILKGLSHLVQSCLLSQERPAGHLRPLIHCAIQTQPQSSIL